MSAPSSASIFVCYRRRDSVDAVDRIYEVLKNSFSRRGLFRDIDAIPIGVDFKSHINQVLQACSVVLVVIGPRWLDARRLHDPLDHVRMEIENALRVEGLRVIPVLVSNATMPSSEELPDSIKELVGRNGLSVRPDPDFRNDASGLILKLREAIAEVRRLKSGQASSSQRRDAHQQSQSKAASGIKAQKPLRGTLLNTDWWRVADSIRVGVDRLSFLPFGFALLGFSFGFPGDRSVFRFLSRPFEPGLWSTVDLRIEILVAFLCFIVVLISSFSKYRWKTVLETIVSWVSFSSLIIFMYSARPFDNVTGCIFALSFTFVGIIMKAYPIILDLCLLLVLGRKPET
jgi:hypothetical protein